jgi:ParB/RepB/Spo0J family partition protein
MTRKITGHLTVPLESIRECDRFRLRLRPYPDVDALAESIRDHGQLAPLFVRATPDGTYELIAGYRRLAALHVLGAGSAFVTVFDIDDEDAYLLAVSDNMLAMPLKPSELARAEKRRSKAN